MSLETTSTVAATVNTAELDLVLRDYLEATQRLQQTHETLQYEIVRLRDELASKDRELESAPALVRFGRAGRRPGP